MGWAFVWMMVVLKIPVAAAIWLLWWAAREPDAAPGTDRGGSDRRPRRDHPRPRRPGPPRRGPHAAAPPPSPRRTRVPAVGIDRAHRRRVGR